MSADLLQTIDLCQALKTRLEAIDHPTEEGAKLFEVVNFNENKDLAQALQDLIILKQRVCLIVPAGESYERESVGRKIRMTRTTSLDLVIADRAYTKGGHEASFGGEKNIGVVVMQDLVVQELAETPQLTGLRWCALVPTDAAFLTIASPDAAKMPGRQAYAINYETPSGVIEVLPTAGWPAPA